MANEYPIIAIDEKNKLLTLFLDADDRVEVPYSGETPTLGSMWPYEPETESTDTQSSGCSAGTLGRRITF